MSVPQDNSIFGLDDQVIDKDHTLCSLQQNLCDDKSSESMLGETGQTNSAVDDTEFSSYLTEKRCPQMSEEGKNTILDFSDNSPQLNDETIAASHDKIKAEENTRRETAEISSSDTCGQETPPSTILEMISDGTKTTNENCETVINGETILENIDRKVDEKENEEKFVSDLVDKSIKSLKNSKSILDACGMETTVECSMKTETDENIVNGLYSGQTILDHANQCSNSLIDVVGHSEHTVNKKCDCDSENLNQETDLNDQKSEEAVLAAVISVQPMETDFTNQKEMKDTVSSATYSFEPMETNSTDHVMVEDVEKKKQEVNQNNESENKSGSIHSSMSACSKEERKEKIKSDVYDIDVEDSNEEFTHNSSLKKFRSSQSPVDTLNHSVQNCNIVRNNLINDNNNTPSEALTVTMHDKNGDEIRKSCKNNTEIKDNGNCPVNIGDKQSKPKVVYVYSRELVEICDQMQKIPNRASMVHSLIQSYGMIKYMRIVAPRQAWEEEIKMFHDPDYIQFLQKMAVQDDTEKYEADALQYGLTYDCPIHQGLYEYATMTAGATIVAAECLLQDECKVAINWCGGWHHAARDQASGFCYINDIVLGILKLKEKYGKVLYVDLDLHHGDGVEDAFSASPKVMTVSFHKYAPGFFPGTGGVNDVGIGKGLYYTVNVPLLDGIRDAEFTPLVCRILNKVKESFQPEAVVCQCGADGLAGDPMESFNLTHKGLGKCLYFILQWNIPTMILGGGGYNLSNTARCWAFLTALAAGKQLPVEIPDHQYFMEYGPDYEIEVLPGNRKNHNTPHYLRQVYGTVMNNISKIEPA